MTHAIKLSQLLVFDKTSENPPKELEEGYVFFNEIDLARLLSHGDETLAKSLYNLMKEAGFDSARNYVHSVFQKLSGQEFDMRQLIPTTRSDRTNIIALPEELAQQLGLNRKNEYMPHQPAHSAHAESIVYDAQGIGKFTEPAYTIS